MFPILISIIEKQLDLAKLPKPELAELEEIPQTQLSKDFLAELETVLPLLKYLSEPLPEWCIEKDDSINVPDDLMPLLNKLGMQLRFHTISDAGETITLCRMTAIAQKFFHDYKPQP